MLNNRDLDGGLGADGSAPQDRAAVAGFETTWPKRSRLTRHSAISGIEALNQWY